MEIDASLDSVIIIAAIAAGVTLVVLSHVLMLRTPPEYGHDEFARGPDNPTVTTIARDDLIARRFFENVGLGYPDSPEAELARDQLSKLRG